MSEKMPMEIYGWVYVRTFHCGTEYPVSNMSGIECAEYHHDDKYRALEAENERLQKVHKELLSIYNKNLNLCATLQVDIIKLSEEIKRLRGQLGYIASFNNVDEEVALKMKKIAMKALDGK